MRSFSLALFAVTALVAGCESMSSRLTDRFANVPPHTRIFAADQKTVYYAAQTAVRKAGLQLGRASIAQWSIDGYAPVRSGTATSDARQTTIEIRLFETETLETRVELLVWEHTEGGFPGSVSERALREHSLYEIYHAALQQVLQDGELLKSPAKP
jgi:hypothetical protein